MPTISRFDGLRVVIYPADHRPEHVHVIGAEGEAVFILHCPAGAPETAGELWIQSAPGGPDQGRTGQQARYLVRNRERFMAINEQEFAQAQKRMRARRSSGYAVAARCEPRTSRIVVRLNTGLELAFPPSLTEGLAPRPRISPRLKSARQGLVCTGRSSTQTCIYRHCCAASLVPGVGWLHSSGRLEGVRAAKQKQPARAPMAAKAAAHVNRASDAAEEFRGA